MTTSKTIDMKSLLAGTQLPALPQSAIKLLELSQDPENGPAEYASPIEADPGLTGQVLKFVNSSYFGFSGEISSVKNAITLVGVRTIKNFALWSAVFSLVPNPKCGVLDLKCLWQDSLRRGLFARDIAKRLKLDGAEECFASALLQDMSVPLLVKELDGEYESLLAQREDGQVRLSQLENERFGWNHAQAAGEMVRQWKLPAEFAAMIEEHCDIDTLIANPSENGAKIAVALSSLLPTTCDERWSECQKFEEVLQNLTSDDGFSVVDVLAQIDEEFESFAPVLNIAAPAKSLVDRYNDVTSAPA